MIIPQKEKSLRIYTCPVCKGTYVETGMAVSCCVLHSPGSCCHYGEAVVSAAQMVTIQHILDESGLDTHASL